MCGARLATISMSLTAAIASAQEAGEKEKHGLAGSP